jgi:hypothetical protein
MSHATAPASAGLDATHLLGVVFVSQNVPVLHAPLLQFPPSVVGGWHVPQVAFGAIAQNFVAHWASNAQAPFAATVPAATAHDAPRFPARKGGQAVVGIVPAQVLVAEAVALVPGAARTPTQVSATRFPQVASSPKAALSPIDEHDAS